MTLDTDGGGERERNKGSIKKIASVTINTEYGWKLGDTMRMINDHESLTHFDSGIFFFFLKTTIFWFLTTVLKLVLLFDCAFSLL